MDREAVGHAGDIVGDRARPVARRGLRRPVRRHGRGIGHVGGEQAPDDRVGLVPHRLHGGMAVHVGEQESLDVPVGRLERRRLGDERPARGRDASRARDAGLGDRRRLSPIASSMNRVMTRRVSSWMTPRASRPGCRASISARNAADERDGVADVARA